MATDRSEYMREYRARKKAEAAEAASSGAEQTQMQEVAEKVVRKRKSSRGGNPASLDDNFKGNAEDISRAIANATRYIKAEPCQSEDEMAERINMYFADCQMKGCIPRWETLALCLGITRQHAWNIATGRYGSPVQKRMLERAKDILSAIDAELVQTGKVNPVVYIFRAKNFYDMKDQQDVVVVPNQPLGEQQTPEQLTEKYSTLIELDGDE